jgi:hypothetical protein
VVSLGVMPCPALQGRVPAWARSKEQQVVGIEDRPRLAEQDDGGP